MSSITHASGSSRNRVKALLRQGQPAFGVFATIPSVALVQIMAASGLDWVLIDMEHGAIDHATAHAMIAATTGTRLVPIVRVAGTSAEHAKRPLDLGAMGINFPMTTRPEDAATAARAVRYPPAGDRAWGPFLAPFHWGLSMQDYVNAADDGILTVITIEDAEALTHIDAVLATPGIDVAVIGPGDLAVSMGFKGRPDHPDLLVLVAVFEAKILAGGVALGGPAPTPAKANEMIARGYRFLGVGVDGLLLHRGIMAALQGVNRDPASLPLPTQPE